MVTTLDYEKWGTLYFEKISDKGEWVSFLMAYEPQPDTLHLKRTDGKKQYRWANAVQGSFCGERYFAALLPRRKLAVVDLLKDVAVHLEGVDAYAFSGGGKFLVTIEKHNDVSSILIRDEKLQVVKRVDGVMEYRFSPDNGAVVYSQAVGDLKKVVCLSLDHLVETSITQSSDGLFSFFVWQENGGSLAFLHGVKTDAEVRNSINHYTLQSRQLKKFDARDFADFPDKMIVGDSYMSMLQIAYDGTKVFFGVVDEVVTKAYDDNQIQIWNGNDKWFYPERKAMKDWAAVPVLMSWWPGENRLLQITDRSRPQVFLNEDQRYAITYNPAGEGPQYVLEPDADYFITDLSTGVTEPWLQKHSTSFQSISVAPGGRYAAYFKDGDWWVYDFYKKTHSNVTADQRKDTVDFVSREGRFFGAAGWGKGTESLLVYDEYNIWEIGLTPAAQMKKLTDGRDRGMSYRIAATRALPFGKRNFDGRIDEVFDTGHLVLKGTSEAGHGYYILNADCKAGTLVDGTYSFSGLRKASQANVYAYVRQRYDRAPELLVTTDKGKQNVVFRSNSFTDKLAWGRSELMTFKDSKGVALKAVLFYPAGYEVGKKYPMVVHIYENQSNQLYNYVNPTMYNEDGFNISNLTTSGYFVLLPDIAYRANDPGVSAADSVVSATKAVIGKGLVDAARIGLIGHSFGGYETNFIITQTNLFAAAVSGAGVGDTQGHYLSIAWNLGKPELFRHEAQQWRMEHSLFDDWESYDRNSPVRFAQKIKTPLFIWSGEADRQVHYYNSIAFYIALKRLNKQQMMVLYPNETHSLENPVFQKDLTVKVTDWFDHYLKKRPAAKWIADGVK